MVKLTVHAPCITSIRGRTDSKFESLSNIIETKCVSEFDMLCTFCVENSIGNVCIQYFYNIIVKKLTVHAPCIMSIRGRTDSKFDSLLHIETKCVSEFDMLCTFCVEK